MFYLFIFILFAYIILLFLFGYNSITKRSHTNNNNNSIDYNVININVFKLINLYIIKFDWFFYCCGVDIFIVSHMTIDAKIAIEKADKVY